MDTGTGAGHRAGTRGIRDPLPWLPHRALNLWVGKQNPVLFTFADRKADQVGRLAFHWQDLRWPTCACPTPSAVARCNRPARPR